MLRDKMLQLGQATWNVGLRSERAHAKPIIIWEPGDKLDCYAELKRHKNI